MEVLENNIYPIFDRMLGREDKEALLGQRGVMVWFTGLSGSGKSTIAIALERELHKRGLLCRILDGDNIRSGINNNLGFSPEDRVERIYINFCNPWPTGSCHKKRLTHPRQLANYRTILAENGEIHFKTDDDDLFETEDE